jgi:hypothetical protein|tara:strand:+ start:1516 stop:1998 length:483 start_codon:yes stop_codon:yes gene_type:complete
MSKTPNTQSQNKHAGRVLSATGAKHSQTNNKSVRKTHTVDGMAQISRNSGGHHATDMGRRGMSGHREHQGDNTMNITVSEDESRTLNVRDFAESMNILNRSQTSEGSQIDERLGAGLGCISLNQSNLNISKIIRDDPDTFGNEMKHLQRSNSRGEHRGGG